MSDYAPPIESGALMEIKACECQMCLMVRQVLAAIAKAEGRQP